MVAKVGRPKSDNPKDIQTRIRMNEEERDMLEFCSQKMGITKTDVVVMGIRKVYEEQTK